jgi:protein-S-isoprenylcysteine O-methyltransferase
MNLPPPGLLGLIYAVSETIISRTHRATKASFTLKDQNSLRFLVVAIWTSVLLAVVAANVLRAARLPEADRFYPVGLGLFAVGIVFRWYSIWVLGRYFTVNVAIATDHKLVESGPYRYLRHPSYTGALLAFLGLGLCMGNAVSLALMVIPIFLAFRRRMEVEEAALLGAFGDSYRAYMQRTKRLVPFVY